MLLLFNCWLIVVIAFFFCAGVSTTCAGVARGARSVFKNRHTTAFFLCKEDAKHTDDWFFSNAAQKRANARLSNSAFCVLMRPNALHILFVLHLLGSSPSFGGATGIKKLTFFLVDSLKNTHKQPTKNVVFNTTTTTYTTTNNNNNTLIQEKQNEETCLNYRRPL